MASAANPEVDLSRLEPAPGPQSTPELDFDLTFEVEFFTRSIARASQPEFIEEGETVEELLTLAQHQRRLRFRRQVKRLIAALAMFTLFAMFLRFAQSG